VQLQWLNGSKSEQLPLPPPLLWLSLGAQPQLEDHLHLANIETFLFLL
jgi:hypothetical protein